MRWAKNHHSFASGSKIYLYYQYLKDADIGTECGALGADPLLDDLDEYFLAALENVLDERLGAAGPRPAHHAAVRTTPAVIALRTAAPVLNLVLWVFRPLPFGPLLLLWSGGRVLSRALFSDGRFLLGKCLPFF